MEDIDGLVESYLQTPVGDRSDDLKLKTLYDADVLLSIFGRFKSLIESSPATVAKESSAVYRGLIETNRAVGLFDERDYLLGESARLAGWACRLLGRYDEAEGWFDRAEATYRHTVNPAPLLANVAYARLAVRYEMRRYRDVLELLPSVISSFERLGMRAEAVKARFLHAVAAKAGGLGGDSLEMLQALREDLAAGEDTALLGQVLVSIGDHFGGEGRLGDAMTVYKEALPLLADCNRPIALAELKWSIGATYRVQNELPMALVAYREARADYQALGMRTLVAQVGLAIADTLVSLGRAREAEWEILAALPTIEEQKMVPEGFAAVALLKESVRQRKADPEALRQLREHLQANKA